MGMMKQQKCNLKNFRSKEWWKQELKSIKWTDVLIIIAFILLFLQVNQVKEIAQDPCSFCFINNFEGVQRQTCKEYIENRINIGGKLDGQFTDLFSGNS
jgi:hypothetical protein